jgi:hypothetical protein
MLNETVSFAAANCGQDWPRRGLRVNAGCGEDLRLRLHLTHAARAVALGILPMGELGSADRGVARGPDRDVQGHWTGGDAGARPRAVAACGLPPKKVRWCSLEVPINADLPSPFSFEPHCRHWRASRSAANGEVGLPVQSVPGSTLPGGRATRGLFLGSLESDCAVLVVQEEF